MLPTDVDISFWSQPADPFATDVNPLLDARYAALQANGIAVTTPGAIKTYIVQQRASILGQLAAIAASFTLSGPSGFNTNRSPITISGSAPVGLANLTVNSVLWPVTWTSIGRWTLRVPLQSGANAFTLVGLDRLDLSSQRFYRVLLNP